MKEIIMKKIDWVLDKLDPYWTWENLRNLTILLVLAYLMHYVFHLV